MIGDMEESELDFVSRSFDYPVAGYTRIMRLIHDRYVVDAAILEVEQSFSGQDISGGYLYHWLVQRGYGKDTSRSVVNAFVSNSELTKELLDGYSEEWMKYGSTYDERMASAGLTERRYYMHFLNYYRLYITPIDYRLVRVEPPEPLEPPEPSERVYKFTQFQAQASMRLTYADKKKGRHLEIFGTFWVRDGYIDDAIPKSVTLLNDFAVSQGYGALTESGSGWAYNGIIEDIDVEYVTGVIRAFEHETEAKVWIDDIDYSRPERFSGRATMIAEWWTDENFDDARRRFDNETSM